MTATFWPAAERRAASAGPAWPVPTTMASNFCTLLERDAGFLHQLAPELEVDAVDLQHPLGRRALGGVAVALQLFDHVGAPHRDVHFLVQALDDLARHFRRAEDPGPLPDRHLGHSPLGEGGHV